MLIEPGPVSKAKGVEQLEAAPPCALWLCAMWVFTGSRCCTLTGTLPLWLWAVCEHAKTPRGGGCSTHNTEQWCSLPGDSEPCTRLQKSDGTVMRRLGSLALQWSAGVFK